MYSSSVIAIGSFRLSVLHFLSDFCRLETNNSYTQVNCTSSRSLSCLFYRLFYRRHRKFLVLTMATEGHTIHSSSPNLQSGATSTWPIQVCTMADRIWWACGHSTTKTIVLLTSECFPMNRHLNHWPLWLHNGLSHPQTMSIHFYCIILTLPCQSKISTWLIWKCQWVCLSSLILYYITMDVLKSGKYLYRFKLDLEVTNNSRSQDNCLQICNMTMNIILWLHIPRFNRGYNWCLSNRGYMNTKYSLNHREYITDCIKDILYVFIQIIYNSKWYWKWKRAMNESNIMMIWN